MNVTTFLAHAMAFDWAGEQNSMKTAAPNTWKYYEIFSKKNSCKNHKALNQKVSENNILNFARSIRSWFYFSSEFGLLKRTVVIANFMK